MSDDMVNKPSALHEAAREFLGDVVYVGRPELGRATSFSDLLEQVDAAEAQGGPGLTDVERLSLLRVSSAYREVEGNIPFIDKALATLRAVFDMEPPERGDTLDERGLLLARRAVAEVAEYVTAPDGEEPGGARLVHGVLEPEGGRSAGSAAEIGPLHIEALGDGKVHVVEQHYGFQFVVAFGEDGRASIASWPSGAPMDLGERAEIGLTGGVVLQVVGGKKPELLFMGEEDGVQVVVPDSHVVMMRADEFPTWDSIHDGPERSFKLSERAMHFYETTPDSGAAKTAP